MPSSADKPRLHSADQGQTFIVPATQVHVVGDYVASGMNNRCIPEAVIYGFPSHSPGFRSGRSKTPFPQQNRLIRSPNDSPAQSLGQL